MKIKKIFFKSAIIIISIIFIILCISSLLSADHIVNVYYEKAEQGKFRFYADSEAVIPYTVKVWFTTLQNFNASQKLPFFAVIKPGVKKQFLLEISPVPGKATLFTYMFNYYPGDCLNARHDDAYLYLIPYEHGTKYKVSQAYNGGFSHIGNLKYAVDFNMPEGTPVYAAREGIVADVKEDSNIGGLDMKYLQHGNFILIYHADNSFAYYIHLKQNGAVVNKGDQVKAGQLIGYSGNTGRSGSPHLHFDVRLASMEGDMLTIPTKFLDHNKKSVQLQPATYYYATHPGKPEYKVILGRNIRNKDYQKYKKKLKQNDKLDVRYETVDDTYIFFAANGYNKEVQVTVKFDLNNMVCSLKNPVEITVPPLTEKYVCLVRKRAVKNSTDYSFEYTFRYYYNFNFIK